MSIISTKKLLISLIVVMGIMMLGMSNQVFANDINKTLKVGQEFVKDGFAVSVSFKDIKNDGIITYTGKTETNTVHGADGDTATISGKTMTFTANKPGEAIIQSISSYGNVIDTYYFTVEESEPELHFEGTAYINEKIYFTTTDSKTNKVFTNAMFDEIYKEGSSNVIKDSESDKVDLDWTKEETDLGNNRVQRRYYFKATEPGNYYIKLTNKNNGNVFICKFHIQKENLHFEDTAQTNEKIYFTTNDSKTNKVFTSAMFDEIYKEGSSDIIKDSESDKVDLDWTKEETDLGNDRVQRRYYFEATEPGNYYIKLTNKNSGNIFICKFNIEGNGGNYVPETDDNGYVPDDNNDIPEPIETEGATAVNKVGKVDNEIEVKDKDGNVIATIFAGEEVTILEKTTDGHYKIRWKKDGVYAHQSYVKNNKAFGEGPNIRTGANGNAKQIGDIKEGQTVTMGEKEGVYYKVSFNIEGYAEVSGVTETGDSNTVVTGGNLLGSLFKFFDWGFNTFKGILLGNGESQGLLQKLTGSFLGATTQPQEPAGEENSGLGNRFMNGFTFITEKVLGEGNFINEAIGVFGKIFK